MQKSKIYIRKKKKANKKNPKLTRTWGILKIIATWYIQEEILTDFQKYFNFGFCLGKLHSCTL